MDISSEEIFGEEGSPLNRTNFAVGVYQNVVYIYGGECSFTGIFRIYILCENIVSLIETSLFIISLQNNKIFYLYVLNFLP